MLMLRPNAIAGAVLLRAMAPLDDPPAGALDGKPVLLLSGATDPIVPAETANRLAGQLAERRARVRHYNLPGGHGLTQMDIGAAKAWLDHGAGQTSSLGG
jgi:phospholipase/carboxylesterase